MLIVFIRVLIIYALIIVASHFYDGIDPRLILYFPCFIFGISLQKIGRTGQLTKGGEFCSSCRSWRCCLSNLRLRHSTAC